MAFLRESVELVTYMGLWKQFPATYWRAVVSGCRMALHPVTWEQAGIVEGSSIGQGIGQAVSATSPWLQMQHLL